MPQEISWQRSGLGTLSQVLLKEFETHEEIISDPSDIPDKANMASHPKTCQHILRFKKSFVTPLRSQRSVQGQPLSFLIRKEWHSTRNAKGH